MGLKGPDLISSLRTLLNKLKTQKSPQGFHLAGSQDFDDGSGNHQPRILVGWRNLNFYINFMFLRGFYEFNFGWYT